MGTKLESDLKTQVVENEKTVMRLQTELDRLSQSSTGMITQDAMINQIKDRDAEIREVQMKYEDYEASFINKENIFKESKHYFDEVMKEIREQRVNNETLR